MKLHSITLLAVLAITCTSANAQPPGGGGEGGGLSERIMNLDENKDGKISKDEVPERLLSIFARIDKDKDGVLTKDEIQSEYPGRDSGRGEDGGRPGGEGGRGREGSRGRGGEGGRSGQGGRGGEGGRGGMDRGPGGMPQFPLMTALDADGDGKISADEINNATAALKKLDRNKDGLLDQTELRPEFGGGPPGGGRPQGDGTPGGGRGGAGGPPAGNGNPGAFVDGMLERMDKDKDGKLTGDEIQGRMRDNLDRVDTNGDKVVDRAELEEMAKRFQGGREGGGGQRRRPPVEE